MVTLGLDQFPDEVLTAPLPEVQAMFVKRAATLPLGAFNRTAMEAISDWMEELSALRDIPRPSKGKRGKTR